MVIIEWEIITIMPSLVCANEEPVVECNENLCQAANCLGFPTAVCKIDACGVCSVLFTDLFSGLAVDCGKGVKLLELSLQKVPLSKASC